MTEEHTLHDTFTLRFKSDRKKKQKNDTPQQLEETEWLNDFCDIYTFSTIENFWRLHHNLPSVTKFAINSSYTLFRKDILPSWEHESNMNGFSFILYIPINLIKEYDNIFLSSLLLFIGNYKEYVTGINGLTFDRKFKNFRIVFWFSDHKYNTPEIIKSILDELNITDKSTITNRIQPHQDDI